MLSYYKSSPQTFARLHAVLLIVEFCGSDRPSKHSASGSGGYIRIVEPQIHKTNATCPLRPTPRAFGLKISHVGQKDQIDHNLSTAVDIYDLVPLTYRCERLYWIYLYIVVQIQPRKHALERSCRTFAPPRR